MNYTPTTRTVIVFHSLFASLYGQPLDPDVKSVSVSCELPDAVEPNPVVCIGFRRVGSENSEVYTKFNDLPAGLKDLLTRSQA